MAGLNVGTSNWGNFRGLPETKIANPKPQGVQGGRQRQGMDVGPSMSQGRNKPTPAPNPRGQMGGLNAGMGSQMHILPSSAPGDAFRQYGTVQGGRVIPPANPYAPPSNLPTGQGAGTWGPINTGPSMMPSPYMTGGGFTGGGMPPMGGGGMGGDIAYHPPTPPGQSPWAYQEPTPPSMPPSFGGNPFGNRNMGGMRGGLRGAYGGFEWLKKLLRMFRLS